MPDYARAPKKFHEIVPAFRNFLRNFALAPDRQATRPVPNFKGNILEIRDLTPRGSVDQIMKEVKKQGGLNAEIQSRIGHQLRAMYDDVVGQGVPDRFVDLLDRLDERADKDSH